MEQLIEEYIAWKATHAPRASVNYRTWLEKFARKVNKPLSKITVNDVVEYHKSLSHYSPYTIQFAMVAVKNFIRFQRVQGRKCVAPELIRVKKVTANSYRALSVDEFNRTIAKVSTNSFYGKRDDLILRLLFETGIRLSELCDLNISDIDPIYSTTLIATKKTVNKRQIFWSEDTRKRMATYLPIREGISKSPALFTGRHTGKISQRLSHRAVQRMVKKYLTRAGINGRSPHSFRHGKAHQLRDSGASLPLISQVLGHVDPKSSFRYMKDHDAEFEQNARRFLTTV